MNLRIKLVVIASIAIMVTSCKKQLDINIDPDNPSLDQGTPELVFPAGVASAAGRIGGDLAIVGGIWAQYYTQNTTSSQYRNFDAFNVTKNDLGSTLLSSPWAELYSGALNDFQFVINKSKESQNWNYHLMGTVMKAYTLQVLVDAYDKVPYTEAFKGSGNLAPKFDDGYTVYKGLLAEIDTALSKNFSASTNTVAGESDFIFPAEISDWSIDPWIQFANTLKLKMFMRMVYAKPAEAEAGIKKLYADGANFLDVDAKMDVFEDAPDKSNPFYEFNFRKLNTDANLKASVTFLSWLQQNNDPRIEDYFQLATNSTGYLGINQGDYENVDPVFNTASKADVRATDPVDFISLAESHFLQAEALERFFNGTGAKAHYDEGVKAAFARYNDNATPFIAAGGRYAYPTAGNFEQKLEAIITQKWASMPGSHALEAFFERNRTNYPRTSAVYSTDASYVPGRFVYPKKGVTSGVFAKRLIWPDVEVSKNPNAPAEEPVTKEVWWDVH
ncbi:MAG TPA: SusD/RagB family nutrient-binding outer membrane lipoprotein [Chitinophagaceae bacterium]|jgi:hypothetical protein|nr:SusD/RagB family nutrient-binding outer membrane lipoprotein [Chitinophagaceae bacterium]